MTVGVFNDKRLTTCGNRWSISEVQGVFNNQKDSKLWYDNAVSSAMMSVYHLLDSPWRIPTHYSQTVCNADKLTTLRPCTQSGQDNYCSCSLAHEQPSSLSDINSPDKHTKSNRAVHFDETVFSLPACIKLLQFLYAYQQLHVFLQRRWTTNECSCVTTTRNYCLNGLPQCCYSTTATEKTRMSVISCYQCAMTWN